MSFPGLMIELQGSKIKADDFLAMLDKAMQQVLDGIVGISISLNKAESVNPQIIAEKLSQCQSSYQNVFDGNTTVLNFKREIQQALEGAQDIFKEAWHNTLDNLTKEEKAGSKEEREYRAQSKVKELETKVKFWEFCLNKVEAVGEDCDRKDKYLSRTQKTLLGCVGALKGLNRYRTDPASAALHDEPEGSLNFGGKKE